MANPKKPKVSNDFDPNKLSQDIDTHGNAIIDIQQRLQALETRLGSNEAIADTLKAVSDKQKVMGIIFSNAFIEMIRHDKDVRTELGVFMEGENRNKVWQFVKGIGLIIWSILLLLIGAVINRFIGK